MTQSFVRQGANIVCSNMTISSPRKLGLNPKKESIETLGITIYSKIPEPLLNILDKKLDACFKCKMPKKVWGGLAAFFAGIAVVAIIVVVVVAAPIAAPAIIAGIATLQVAVATAAIATVATVAAVSYTVYSVEHACDVCTEGDWEQFHPTVLIENQPALLNKSQLMCPTGGTLDIIIDDELALKAAQLISSANTKEVWLHWGSKFIAGGITFATSGPLGVTISSSLEIYNTCKDEGISNQNWTIFDGINDVKNSAIQYVGSNATGMGIEHLAANQGGSLILEAAIWGMDRGIISKTAGDKVLDFLVRNGKPFSWKNFGSNLKAGLTTALIGFAIDQLSNVAERHYEQQAGDALEEINEQDQKKGNNIGIIAVTQ